MPYQSLLDRLVQGVDGAQCALLLDSEGEVVVEAGAGGERHRLIGAYQGIALTRVRDTGERYDSGPIDHILCRYFFGHVILRPLKDGYYLVMSMAPDANVGQGLFHSAEARDRMNAEL